MEPAKPTKPEQPDHELTDEDLEQVSGGLNAQLDPSLYDWWKKTNSTGLLPAVQKVIPNSVKRADKI